MHSIRFSLILYFLLLLGAALGAVSYFCYQSTQEALLAREKSTKELWKKQFEDNRKRATEEFNDKVLAQARTIKEKAVWYQDRPEMLSVGLGTLASQPHNGGPFAASAYILEAIYPQNAVRLYQPRLPNILIEPPHDDDHLPSAILNDQYYQTYIAVKDQLIPLEHSRTLPGFPWTLEKITRQKADVNQEIVDEINLPSGPRVRRVTLRTTVRLIRRGLVVEPKLDGKLPDWKARPGPQLPPLPAIGEERQLPNKGPGPRTIYLQFGVDTAGRDVAIADLRDQLDRDLAALHEDLNETRATLRSQLFWIGLGTFAALVLGGFWLVRLGLKPLDRLSEAVSKVSEKDFRLPIDQNHLPGELRPIAGRLAETLDQLKRVFEREKQAAADISHELRTPVAALITTLDITLRRERSADEYREVLEECRSSGRRMSQLVERLLTLARLDAGADILRAREVDVAALADQCVALVRPLAEARGLQLNLHNNGPASVHADPEKLREVLTNLLHNAIEYNKPNGSVDVNVQRNNGTLSLEVRDTGIGISAQAQKRVFERFYRVDPSRHADTPHAGLGLAIVKGFVDLMGGSIDLDSSVDTGTTFRVQLPVR